ncbi:MAG: hypothetical protein LBQ00_03685 [Syntrophobacterales bacterium]|nr:hypothetical protein [Syntrophobacterales bacterium]
MRNLFVKSNFVGNIETLNAPDLPKLDIVIDDFYATGKKTIFVIGKGGVKKASFVSVITIGLSPPPKKKGGEEISDHGRSRCSFEIYIHSDSTMIRIGKKRS